MSRGCARRVGRLLLLAWASVGLLHSAGALQAAEGDVRINEILYRPPPGLDGAEFVELHNRGGETVLLGGWELSGDVTFRFPASTALEPGAYGILVRDRTLAESLYPAAAILGTYQGALSDRGGYLRLTNAAGLVIDEFAYGTGEPWPRLAAGGGASLEKVRPELDSWFPDSWGRSLTLLGSPGRLNTRFRSLEPVTFIAAGEDWRWVKGTAEPSAEPLAWTAASFDDSAWNAGPSGFGYGDDDDATVLDDMEGAYTTVYIRKRFQVVDPSRVRGLFFEIDYDDGFVAYLNGVEIARRNAPGAPGDLVPFDALASGSHEAGTPETIDASAAIAYLVQGENVLAVQGLNVGPTSSDFSLLPALEGRVEVLGVETSLDRLARRTAVPRGAVWKYHKGTTEPSAELGAWAAPGFDDSAWLEGPAGFGYGDGDDATLLDDMRNTYSTVYIRKTFTVESLSDLSGMTLGVDYDDGFIAYLNGIEVARSRAPGNPGEFQPATAFATGGHEAGTEEFFDLSAHLGLLVEGENVLAIQGFNATLGSGDFSLHPELSLLFSVSGDPEAVLAGLAIHEVYAPGDGTGWVEVRNLSSQAIDAGGFGLSDDALSPSRFTIPAPAPLGPGEYLVVDESALGFALPTSGTLFLTDGPGVVLIDGRNYSAGDPPLSAGLTPQGDFARLEAATPGAANAPPLDRGIVVNEIQYDPQGGPDGTESEWIELHNRTGAPVDLTGWRLEGSIAYAFPAGTVISAGGFLVVASDPSRVEADYGVSGVLGPFAGVLENGGGEIVLRDDFGDPADRVAYAPGGSWPPEAAGTGPSAELADPSLDNDTGQAWLPSEGNGTPGAPNSASGPVPPLVTDVAHRPPVPAAGQAVAVSLRARAQDPIAEARLFWRAAPQPGDPAPPFTLEAMADDGLSGDGEAGDGVYAGTIPGQAGGTVVEYYVEVEDAAGRVRRVPATAPEANHLFVAGTSRAESGIPLLRLVLTPEDRSLLATGDPEAGGPFNATLIASDSVLYGARVQVREPPVDPASPPGYRLEFPPDRPFGGARRLDLDGGEPERRHLGFLLFRGAAVPAPLSRIVELVLGDDPPLTYVQSEVVDGGFLKRVWRSPPGEHLGNLYEALEGGDLSYKGPDPAAYSSDYRKVTNEEVGDWSDLIALVEVLNETAEADLGTVLPQVIDIEEWLRFFAVHALLGNQETGIYSDGGGDFSLYRRPSDGRWVILPGDVDQGLRSPQETLFRPTLFQVARILQHPDFTPLYYSAIVEIASVHFTAERVNAELEPFSEVLDPAIVEVAADYAAQRAAFIDAAVNRDFTAVLRPEALVARGAEWRFFRGRAEPAEGTLDWTLPGFDDSSWEVGPSGIGYGDGDDATVLDDMQNNYTTVYMRHVFTVDDPSSLETLELAVDFDDGFVAYLNGVEIGRANAGPAGSFVPFDALATDTREAGTVQVFDFDAGGLLVPGANVLALVGLNATLDSTDFSLIPELRSGGVVGEGCPGEFFVSGGSLVLEGQAPVTQAREVLVNGARAAYDHLTGAWSYSAPLEAGESSFDVEVRDLAGASVAAETIRVRRVRTVGGTVAAEEVWAAERSPYLVTASVSVPAGARLEIEPGTEILVGEGRSFRIDGELAVLGTADAPVLFTRLPCHANWGNIEFRNRSQGTLLYAEIERATGNPGAVTVRSATLFAEGSHIHNIDGEGISASGSTVTVRNCLVERTNEALSLDFGRTVVEFSTMRNVIGKSDLCDANGSNNPPARIAFNLMYGTSDDGIDADRGSVFAEGNIIRNCGDQAISLVGTGNSFVTRNICYRCNHGLSVKDSHRCVADFNTFAFNNSTGVRAIEKNAGRGGGIVTVKNSIVWGNGTQLFTDPTGFIEAMYSCIQGDPVFPGEGNINLDPEFVDASAGDFRLQPTSPCIGRAENGDDIGALPFEIVPRAPSDLQVVATTSGTIGLTWKDNSFVEEAFQVERRESAGADPVPLIPQGALWRFFRGRSEPSGGTLAWTDPDFDDSGWEEGPAGIGYGDGDDATVLADMENGYTTVYLRGRFTIDDPDAVQSLSLRVDFDDGFVAYLNGVEVARAFAGLPGRFLPFDAVSEGLHEAGDPLTVEFSTEGLLRAGENVLAVQGLNASLTSSDFSLHPELFLADPAPFTLYAVLPANSRSFTDTAVQPATVYSYRVRAVNGEGPSGYSNIVTRRTVDLPEAPSDLTVAAVAPDEITLLWTDNSSVEENFELQRAEGEGGFGTVAFLPADATQYRDTGLVEGETYRYRVRALNGFGPSEWSNVVTQVTGRPPAAPSGLHLIRAFADALEIGWTDDSDNETGFELEIRFGLEGNFHTRAVLPADASSYLDEGLDPGTTYTYRVRAFNEIAKSAWSNELVAETGRLPPAPLDLTVSDVGLDFIRLAWLDPGTDETGFELERQGPADADFVLLAALPPDTTSYTDAGLSPGTTYRYRIRAVNAFGPSAYSNIASGTTGRLPAPPLGLSAAAVGLDTIELSWLDVADNETGYELERRTEGGAFERIQDLPPDSTSAADTGLTPGTEYCYRVRAVNRFGASPYSEELCVVTGRLPAAPSGLAAAEVGYDSAVLVWEDNADNETGFEVERSEAGGPFVLAGTAGADVTTFRDSGLAQGTEYTYRVRAVNAFGASEPSNALTVVTGRLPRAPEGLEVVLTAARSVAIAWVDTADNETGYEVERQGPGGGAFERVALLPADTTTYTDEGLEPASAYAYRVRAVNEFGASEWAGPVEARTSALPPRLDLVEPDEGPVAGGTAVVFRGENFIDVLEVTIGGAPLASLEVVSETEIRGVTPPGLRGPADVAVITGMGESVLDGGFRYFEPYLRGDVNADGTLDISDPVALLGYLFLGGAEPPCEDVANGNGDASLDIGDAIFLLQYLFQGGRAPEPEEARCF